MSLKINLTSSNETTQQVHGKIKYKINSKDTSLRKKVRTKTMRKTELASKALEWEWRKVTESN